MISQYIHPGFKLCDTNLSQQSLELHMSSFWGEQYLIVARDTGNLSDP